MVIKDFKLITMAILSTVLTTREANDINIYPKV